ncbi:MAG: hypothetical protein KME16_02850 [Scytolyngbya sp. HA4215-MV1]|jgi:chaperonin cofactor prefoldin|nr:hypothetical protein [Scytolyngbya sp. HA4215-MV1]
MNRFRSTIVIGAISLLALVGCNKTAQSTADTSPTASPSTVAQPSTSPTTEASTQTTTASQPANSRFGELIAVITKTKTSVDTGNFAKAKDAFDQFEDSWSKVEDGVKAKSSKIYDEIEKNAETVSNELKTSKPDKAKVAAALQALNQDITTAAKP